jgi:hypothetical protein
MNTIEKKGDEESSFDNSEENSIEKFKKASRASSLKSDASEKKKDKNKMLDGKIDRALAKNKAEDIFKDMIYKHDSGLSP